jgi:predicted O-methyltransferase YrrM
MNLYTLSKYLKYILFSAHRKGHGLHSPFVFDLVTKVFRNKINPDIVLTVESIRKKLISDQRILHITDFGTGSMKERNNLRRVSEIARYSSVPTKYGILLANMSSEFGKPSIIEFGTSLGISTIYMAAACPDATVCTIEGCPETSEVAKENFKGAGLKNIKLVTGSFDEVLPAIERDVVIPGLVFIDGNHKKAPVLEYFSRVAAISDSKTVIVLDDIHYSSEMGEAWEEIKKHEKVSLTVDIFRMGFVFFREGMTHFDYIIRY